MEEITNPSAPINLIDDDFEIALNYYFLLPTLEEKNMVFFILLFHLKKIEERKVHNMLSLMLNPRFKILHLVFSFVGQEEVVSIVVEYYRRICILCF
jgi:hypothetical protein